MVEKSNAIPVTGRGGPCGCETSRISHFLDIRLADGGEAVSLAGHFSPQEVFRYSFFLEAANPKNQSAAGRIR
jgi:hypothetical protein